MCDTLVATGATTPDGVTLFAKNSDRDPNEAHHLLRLSAADYSLPTTVRCTYIEIPQVAHTHAVLLAKPFWIWGAEMGANEHGLAIGNEAVFTKVPQKKEPALIGMDLLRLALERAVTAFQAVEVITSLLETHGQGGNCGFAHPFEYHNSFLIADPSAAWVLETAGVHWAAKQIHGVYTISNVLSLGNDFDLASPDLVAYAVSRGWCKGRDDFDFARCYSDNLYTTFAAGRHRCSRTRAQTQAQAGSLTPLDLMTFLRDHGEARRTPDQGFTGSEVCMHVGFGPIRINQTTGSMVSVLDREKPVHFFTATAAPCTSIFKPAWVDVLLPDTGPVPQGTYDPASLFWQHEKLHRLTLKDYSTLIREYAPKRDELEREFVDLAARCAGAEAHERQSLSAACFERAREAEKTWLEHLYAHTPRRPKGSLFYRQTWTGINKAAQIEV